MLVRRRAGQLERDLVFARSKLDVLPAREHEPFTGLLSSPGRTRLHRPANHTRAGKGASCRRRFAFACTGPRRAFQTGSPAFRKWTRCSPSSIRPFRPTARPRLPGSNLRKWGDVQEIIAAFAGAVDQVANQRGVDFQFWSFLL